MRSIVFIATCSFLLVSCSAGETVITGGDGGEMTGAFDDDVSKVLFVDPLSTLRQRNELIEELKRAGSRGSKRALFARYVPIIGANGVLKAIETVWPLCHSEAHDLGKVIYEKTSDVETALAVCRDGCYSGCMHGVLMEAFAGARDANDPEGHVDVQVVKEKMNEVCNGNKVMTSAYSPGDCAHAIGHALMVLADYHVPEAVGWCDEFNSPHMRYYCATGTYMEYVTERDRIDVAAGAGVFYPCDANKYPAACARYKIVHVIPRLVKSKADVQKFMLSCNQLQGTYRLGCWHGAGNGFMGAIVAGRISLQDVCGQAPDDDRFVCIEGAMERMAKYHPEKAKKVCEGLNNGSKDRQTCDAAIQRGMYDMGKDLSLYLEE